MFWTSGLLLGAAAIALGWRAWCQQLAGSTLAITTPNGIEEELYVPLGGIDQWVTVRGEDRSNPILLVLAGGPGNSLVPLAPVFRDWERHFTIVQWDQRGAGKTFGRNGTAETPMTMARMRDDGLELTHWLVGRLGQPKLVLVGHSWGSMLGLLMVKARPDLFYAFVGTGQVVAKAEKESVLYARLMRDVEAADDSEGRARLVEIGPPPYASEAELLLARAVSERYDTEAERRLEERMRNVVLCAPNFSLYDIWSMLRGSTFSSDALYAETLAFDARTLAPALAVPFFVFNGEFDRVTPTDLVRPYVESIDAPAKALVVLPGGGHSAMLTMPDVFLNELVDRVRPLATDG